MRFAVAISVLALGAGSTAFAQDVPNKDEQIRELQKQVADIQAKLAALQGDSAPKTESLESRLDGAVRKSPAEALSEPRRLNISAPGLDGLEIKGGIHVRGDYWGNYDAGGGKNDANSFGEEAWVELDQKISDKTYAGIVTHYNDIWGRNTVHGLGNSSRLTNVGAPTGSNSNTANLSVTEAYLGMHDIAAWGVDMKAGRQRIEYGAERIIGDDDWRLTRTSFDGLRFDGDLGGGHGNWSVIAVRLQDSENVTTDPPGNDLRPNDAGTTGDGSTIDNADLFGAYYTMKRDHIGMVDGYIFHLYDPNKTTATATRFTTYGARWESPTWSGVSVEGEGATQFGTFQGVETNNYGFGTWAAHLGAKYAPPNIQYLKAVKFGYDYATGGGRPEYNFVQLFPSLHGWFGITDLFSWTNINHWMIGSELGGLGPGTFEVAWHWNRLASSRTEAGTANGATNVNGYNFTTTGVANHKDLGEEGDIIYSLDCAKTTKVWLGIGYFIPGTGYHDLTGSTSDMVYGFAAFRTTF